MFDGLSEEEQRLLLSLRFSGRAGRAARPKPSGTREWGAPARRSPRSTEPAPGSFAAVISEFEQCGPETAKQFAMRWAREMFTPGQVRAWLQAGLQTNDLELVVELRSLGVPPKAMGWVVRKETMLERIRQRGYTAQAVARTLRQEGLLPPQAA